MPLPPNPTGPADGGRIFLRNTGTKTHDVTTQATTTGIFTVVRTTNLNIVCMLNEAGCQGVEWIHLA